MINTSTCRLDLLESYSREHSVYTVSDDFDNIDLHGDNNKIWALHAAYNPDTGKYFNTIRYYIDATWYVLEGIDE